MASIPNNIVAKDSDGNIKKVKFEDIEQLIIKLTKRYNVQMNSAVI